MAIKVSGTTVIDDSRKIENITELESYTYKGKIQNIGDISGTVQLDVSAGDNIVANVIGTTVFTVTGLKSGSVNTFTLILSLPAVVPGITFFSGVTWDKQLNPVLPAAGKTVLLFETYDNGTTWSAAQAWRSAA